MKEPSYMILRRAFKLYTERDQIAYFFGAKGQVLTDAVMDALIADKPEHFAKYTEAEMKKIRKFSKGKVGYDCSGFVGRCVGDMLWSGGLWENTIHRTTIADGKAGCILYRPGHVALDIGYGYAMDCPTEGHTIEIFKNNEGGRGLLEAGEYKTFDYSLANNY